MTDSNASAVARVVASAHLGWALERPTADAEHTAARTLELGDVLFFPGLTFEVETRELRAFSPGIVERAKQVAFDPTTGRIGGTSLSGEDLTALTGMLGRFS